MHKLHTTKKKTEVLNSVGTACVNGQVNIAAKEIPC